MSTELASNLNRFVRQWREVKLKADTPFDAARLVSFFQQARVSLRSSGRRPTVRPGAMIDVQRLGAALAAVAVPLAQVRRNGFFLDPWIAARISRNEVRNAAVLASFLDPRRCGNLATRFLQECLARANPPVRLPSLASELADYLVRTEHLPLGEASDRVDITIEGRTFLLGIEVKIDAAEGPDQLARYRNALRTRARLRDVPLTLMLLGYQPPRDGVAPHLRWKDLVRAARASIAPRIADRTFNERLLDQFANHVASL